MSISAFRGASPAQGESQFQLSVDLPQARAFEVVSFRGREEMSKPFCFDVLILAPPDADLQDLLLGQPAALTIAVPDRAPRLVRGIVASVEPQSPAAVQGYAAYQVRLVPRLWLLRHRVTSRIFQERTVPEIVSSLLGEANIAASFKLSRAYPRRAYCVQYQESDLAFIRRLLAEEGIFYFFENLGAERETVIFGDSPEAYPAIVEGAPHGLDVTGAFVLSKVSQVLAPRLRVRDRGGMSPTEDDVFHFSLRRTIRPGAVLLRDYDFRRPQLDLKAEAVTEGGDAALRVYRHRGEYDEAEVAPAGARTQLEQHRRSAVVGEGQTACRRLLPGHRFRLAADSAPKLAGEYVVTRVEHEGHAPAFAKPGSDAYTARFTCVPADVSFRPKRLRRALRQVLESATVVGPLNEEIHVDALGRIKVQFHWDLHGQHNEHSSCWIRVVQGWAGASWGLQFIPRVGMEVMVSFLGGDQDCPVIVGCVYNATHPVPFMLPAEKTRSGIRTNSTPGGGGFNELSFEDRHGGELIYLHAQRDLQEEVLHDRITTIGHNETSTITGNQSLMISGNRSDAVAGDQTVAIAKSSFERIGDALRTEVGKSRWLTVHGEDHEFVKRSRTTTIEGLFSIQAGGLGLTIGSGDAPQTADIFSWGDCSVGAGRTIRLTAQDRLVLQCGDSAIELNRNQVTIRSGKLAFEGTESVTVAGKGPSLVLGEEAEIVSKAVRIVSSKASLVLEEDARLDGVQVKLNCKGISEIAENPDGTPLETQRLSLKLTDPDFVPYANKEYMLTAGGVAFEGSTGPEGQLELDIPKHADAAQVVLFVDGRPTGKMLRYNVALRDLPEATSVRGAQTRLKNLGYFWGEIGDELDVDAARALREFQEDHGIEPTGRLDSQTAAKLSEVHGH
ncbi:type VI secretion system tip protein TssI/VgrG [Polyangium mundeleinium]|uniref:Type VI secretion system tip protein TssI/VgrG n=1 Tax=Polyangium mundeleinium TaxID=2995306 RepID=A0ABT5ENA5_9BACT|nr:type VI secretion system tip protein TssI/VgrG [Polyangium mundeleinium]MDC0743226.1 type VI secretion system tip protein TssI/VgrG [Polyangium mundeleinium]